MTRENVDVALRPLLNRLKRDEQSFIMLFGFVTPRGVEVFNEGGGFTVEDAIHLLAVIEAQKKGLIATLGKQLNMPEPDLLKLLNDTQRRYEIETQEN